MNAHFRTWTAAPAEGDWLAPMSGHWIDSAVAQLSCHVTVVRVTVGALRGSAPREPGASMLVDAVGMVGTIGGGQLEWRAIDAARELLHAHADPIQIHDWVLGPDLGQCCGGRVELWLERLTRADLPWLRDAAQQLRDRAVALVTNFDRGVVTRRLLRPASGHPRLALQRHSARGMTLSEMSCPPRAPLCIFGAGHVGQALVRLLSDLDLFDIDWIDSRPELLPSGLAGCVTTRACAVPTEWLAQARPGTCFVVLTHDHGLDYELCRRILARGDFAWLGLIGSASKAARFRARLRRDGYAERLLGLTCPIGVGGITSKRPAAIAIAVAAQLLQQHAVLASSAVSRSPPAACTGHCASCGSENGPR